MLPGWPKQLGPRTRRVAAGGDAVERSWASVAPRTRVQAVLGPDVAAAHDGYAVATDGFRYGFAHPLHGIDHRLAIVSVSVTSTPRWEATPSGRSRETFIGVIGVMGVGGALGILGVVLPEVEVVLLSADDGWQVAWGRHQIQDGERPECVAVLTA